MNGMTELNDEDDTDDTFGSGFYNPEYYDSDDG